MSYEPISLPDRIELTLEETIERAKEHLFMMRKRHSVREYSTRAIPNSVLESALSVAASAPSGANQQPWHFAVIRDPLMKQKIRDAAEAEERKFYAGAAGDEWISALEPIGTGENKPHLTDAPALIVVFAQRYGLRSDGSKYKHYYVNESVGIAIGFLIAALHNVGLVCLPHTPNPMKFLNLICNRPDNEKPMMILPVGYPAEDAKIPQAAKIKKPFDTVTSWF